MSFENNLFVCGQRFLLVDQLSVLLCAVVMIYKIYRLSHALDHGERLPKVKPYKAACILYPLTLSFCRVVTSLKIYKNSGI